MKISEFANFIKKLVIIFTGLIVTLLFFRFILDLFGSNYPGSFMLSFKNFTDSLMSPFQGILVDPKPSDFDSFNELVLISSGFYILISFIILHFVDSFLKDSLTEIFVSFIDSIFKIIEFIFFLRIIFDLFQVVKTNLFVSSIYNSTNWADDLINISFLNGRLNFSIILILVFIVFLDYISESFFDSILKKDKKPNMQQVNNYYPVSNSQSQQPVNVTVNVPPTQTYVQQPVIGQPVNSFQRGNYIQPQVGKKRKNLWERIREKLS